LFRRLKPVETNYHRDLCCMDGTRQSLLNHITDWVANKAAQEVFHSNTYWFYGSPGIGKTSLAHSICANLHEQNHLAGAFFCRRDDPDLSKPINILPTFIHKLAMIFPPFRSIVAKRLRDDPNLTPGSMKAALVLDFIRSLPHHPEHTLAFVIDAFDKCGNPRSRPGILKVLIDAATRAPWLKIIITSRTKVDIQHFFSTLTQSSYLRYDLATDRDPVLICGPSPEASSIWLSRSGIYPHHGLKNRTSTTSSLGRTVSSSSSKLSFLLLSVVRTPRSRCRQRCTTQPGPA